MARYLLTISYLGTDFCGWQVQPNGISVQQVLGEALNRVFHNGGTVTGCSRTDSGVHANMFCCHTDFITDLSASKIIAALNNNLPDTIAVTDCRVVDSNFHARYSCIGKNYIYKINNLPYLNPFSNGRAYWFKYKLNIEDMKCAAEKMVGKHDFSAFCSANASVTDKVRTITECTICENNGEIIISVSADGFLYNMVRIIVGTLLDVGRGKISPEKVLQIIESKNRENAGFTAPPQGLYLNRVFYEE